MIITALVTMCHIVVASPSDLDTAAGAQREAEHCEPAIVTDSERSPAFTFMQCMMSAQPALAQWKMNHPIYSSDAWRVAGFDCITSEKPLNVERDV